MKESLFSSSLMRFKKNAPSYIAVGIFSGLFLILAATLSFFDISICVLVIPFIVFPFLFASHVACYYLEVNQPINAPAISRYFLGFFRPQFRSSFRGIRSFLTSLAVYFGAMVLVYVICYGVYRHTYGDTFTDSFTNLVQLYYNSSTTYEDLTAALNANDGFLLTFFIYVTTLPIPFAILWFIYSISFSSISIYYRLNIRAAAASLTRLAINATYSKCKSKIRADWFRLNWPLLALSLVGSVAGILIAFLLIENVNLFPGIVTLGSVILILFFLPLYFSNMEVIYHRYEESFKDGNKMAVESILMRIQNSIDLSEEEKRNLEESFKEDTKEEE